MPSTFAQLILFVSSYAPLLVVFAVLDSFGNSLVQTVLVLVASVSAAALGVLVGLGRRLHPVEVRVDRHRPRDADTAGYVVTYLIPFLGVPTDSRAGQAAVGILFFVVAVSYVRSRLFYVNPLLNLVGFRLLEVETGDRSVVLVTRDTGLPGRLVLAHSLGTDVYLEAHPRAH